MGILQRVNLLRRIQTQHMVASSGTDFRLCVFASAPRESKPHRLKAVPLGLR